MQATPDSKPGIFTLVFSFCWDQWRRQPVRIPLMAAAMLGATLIDATVPVFAGRLIDAVTHDHATAAVHAVLSIMALALSMVVLRYTAFWLLSGSSTQVMRRIVGEAFFRVQRFSTDWHASTFAGATVRQISRGMWAYDVFADTLILGFFPAFVVLVAVTVSLALRWPGLGLLVAAGAVAYFVVSVSLMLRYVSPSAKRANEADSRLGAALADAIGCNTVVKSFAAEAREDARLADLAEMWRGRTFRTWIRGSQSYVAQQSLVICLQAAVLGGAVWLWAHGRAGAGDIAYVMTTYAVVQGYLREAGNHIRNLQRSVNDLEDIATFRHLPIGVEDRGGAPPLRVTAGAIAFERVTFRYRGADRPLYRDLSLRIAPGETVGLVGPSGSGKSTFVKLIQRLYDVEQGRVTIDGQNVAEVSQTSLRRAVAVVAQEPVLFHRSLAENIAYGRPDATRAEIERAARQANAHDFIAAFAQGYDTLVGERGVKLSGGERQRVALARAVLAGAEILILDEATSSLDSVSELLLQRAIEQVTAGRTTIIIAHRLSTVRRVDRILVFDQGEVVEQGTHAQLLARPGGRYRELFEHQALGLVDLPGDARLPLPV